MIDVIVAVSTYSAPFYFLLYKDRHDARSTQLLLVKTTWEKVLRWLLVFLLQAVQVFESLIHRLRAVHASRSSKHRVKVVQASRSLKHRVEAVQAFRSLKHRVEAVQASRSLKHRVEAVHVVTGIVGE